MAIIVLQHTASEGPGRLGTTLRDFGRKLDIRRLDLPAGDPGAGGLAARNQHVPTDFDGVDGILTLGGGMMVGDPLPWMQPELDFLAAAHKRNLPIVGICLGAQMIAKALGGEVGPMPNPPGPEWGLGTVKQLPVAAGQPEREHRRVLQQPDFVRRRGVASGCERLHGLPSRQVVDKPEPAYDRCRHARAHYSTTLTAGCATSSR